MIFNNKIVGEVVLIMVCHVIICPTNPAVPIPEPVALLVIFKIIVPTGPKIALAKIGGIQIIGFL